MVFFRHGFFSNNTEIEQGALTLWRNEYFNVASIGLDFFSVLSSFLITYLILEEYKQKGVFDLKNFYMRRILRIWPLYFLIVFIGYIIVPLASQYMGGEEPTLPPVFWFLSFTSNYYSGYIDQDYLFFLVFLWFIAVEEQFYLVWGLLLRFFKNYFLHIGVVLIALHLLIKLFFSSPEFPAFYDTLNFIPNFVIGGFLAFSCIEKNNWFCLLKVQKSGFWIGVYFLLFLVFVFYNPIFSFSIVDSCKHFILSALFGLILFENTFTHKPLFNLSKHKVINYIGKLNFGLYCWHGVVITVVKKFLEYLGHADSLPDVFLVYPAITLIITIFISIISFEFFEKYFLKLKQYFRSIE